MLGDVEGFVLLGGLFSFDLVEQFEFLLVLVEFVWYCLDYLFLVLELLLDIDYLVCWILLQVFVYDLVGYDWLVVSLCQCVDEFYGIVEEVFELLVVGVWVGNYQVDLDDVSFVCQVECLQVYVRVGDVFQIVLLCSFSMLCVDFWWVYCQLCLCNFSLYCFFFDVGDFCLFGVLLELVLKYDVESCEVEFYFIVGICLCGCDVWGVIDVELDNCLEVELCLDVKEIVEYMMLVDLVCNDLVWVCCSGMWQVCDMFKVDCYSYVMYLVLCVVGELYGELDVLYVYCVCLNMGILVGVLKVCVMQLLWQYEDGYCGSYGGVIGIFDSVGNFDISIVICFVEVCEGIVWVWVGVGVVLDLDLWLEVEEICNKVLVVLIVVVVVECERGECDVYYVVG